LRDFPFFRVQVGAKALPKLRNILFEEFSRENDSWSDWISYEGNPIAVGEE
jgi:hypothetical protein